MIFGKSYFEKSKIEQAKLKKLKGRVKTFAWRPVKENLGRWVWLSYVYKDIGVRENQGHLYISGSRSIIYHLKDSDN